MLWRILGQLRFVWTDRKRVVEQLERIGVNSIPLVLLTGLFSGAIIAWQGAYQFKGLAPLSLLGGQIARSILMEMGPVLTAMVISGRVGASMAAEIGYMKLSQQLDALQTLSIDSVRYLVMPRFLGLTIMLPILTLFAISIAMIGAFGVSAYFLDLSPAVFWHSVQDFFRINDLLGGLFKAWVFGMSIAVISCHKGLIIKGGAQEMGRAAVSAFVLSAVFILAADFLLWIILF